MDSPYTKLFLAIIAILSFGLWFIKHEPKIGYSIQSEIKLINPSIDYCPIHIYIDSIDASALNKNITSYVVEVKNVGSGHLRVTDYDEGKFGLRVENGTILGGPMLVSSSINYIEERFRAARPSADSVFIEIPRISLDKQNGYNVSFLVLHDNDVTPSLSPVGKIIGQSRIFIRYDYKESIWPLLVQGDRIYILMFVAVFCLGGLFLFLLSIVSILKKSFVSITFQKWDDDSKSSEAEEL